jgi:hypothetical protein
MGKETSQALHAHTQKRVRRPKPRIYFDSPSEALARLKKFGAAQSESGTIYIEKRIGLKVLGAVDYLSKMRKKQRGVPMVIFGKCP